MIQIYMPKENLIIVYVNDLTSRYLTTTLKYNIELYSILFQFIIICYGKYLLIKVIF